MRLLCLSRFFLAALIGAGLSACAGLPFHSSMPDEARIDSFEIQSLTEPLRNFALDRKRSVLASRGRRLFRISGATGQTIPVRDFSDRINAVHVMKNGAVVVATDADHWDPESPCHVWLSTDDGVSFDRILSFTGGSALWWSITSDSNSVLYVGEYGPRGSQYSKRVVATDNAGKTWRTVFESPARDGSHIHRVAIDPWTDDLWVSVGDGREHRGVYRRHVGDTGFEKVIDSQATAIAFDAEAVWLGEDRPKRQGVSRFDRATGKLTLDLDLDRLKTAGGSIYSLLADGDGQVFAPTMRYPGQRHRAYLWARQNQRWRVITELALREDGSAGSETLAGPDASGWFYASGFRWRSRVGS